MPTDETAQRAAMKEEAERIEAWGRVWDTAYRGDANRWSHIAVVMGVVAAVLGAVAGYSGLAKVTGAFGVSLLALAAAVVAGVTSSVRPAAKSTDFSASAVDNSTVADKARVFRLTQVDFDSIETAVADFTKLCEQRDVAVKAAPPRRAPGRRSTYISKAMDPAWPDGYVREAEPPSLAPVR
jgi:hypothetical protein